MSDLITKRLHISGLTPSLSRDDLQARLSSFGTVECIDGFGSKDALGQPRPFAFATVQGTAANLRRCVNVLSGSTWKGAKLRIGDAKPDFKERLAKERIESNMRPIKRARTTKHTARHASDMSLVTPANVASRSGWKVTSTGKLIRPMRMRPARPLTPPIALRERNANHPRKKRTKDPPIRARRRTIDMTQWGGERLSGLFLGALSDAEPMVQDERLAAESLTTNHTTIPLTHHVDEALQLQDSVQLDVSSEKNQSLRLLQTLFGGLESNESDWIGRESVEFDDQEDLPVSRNNNVASPTETSSEPFTSKLRDLFAPHEEGAFSLVNQLDLDLEEDSMLESAATVQAVSSSVPNEPTPPPMKTPSLTLDSRKARFFPSSQRNDLLNFPRNHSLFKFFRTDNEEMIQKRWEASKVELTRGWKKRWREAGKVRRRLGVTVDNES